MKSNKFSTTITAYGKCYNIPRDMPIPRQGEIVFIDNHKIVVSSINYHIYDDNSYSISIFGNELTDE